MKTKTFAVLTLGLALTGMASAQATWNLYSGSAPNVQGLASGCSQNGANTGSFNNSWNCTVATTPTAQSATVSAWSSNSDRGTPSGTGSQYALTGSGYASAYISSQGTSGFGATSRVEAQSAAIAGDTTPLDPTSPDHSFDSIAPGSFDLMLIDFGASSVVLNQIGIGWSNGNADLTLLRWTGTSAPVRTAGTSTLLSDGEQNLASTAYNPATPATAGWQLVGSYADLATDNGTPFGGAARSTGATQASSWWLISAFNTALNGGSTTCKNAAGANTTCGEANNGFKLNYIATTSVSPPKPPSAVPEPTSLALVAMALLGAAGSRRLRKTT